MTNRYIWYGCIKIKTIQQPIKYAIVLINIDKLCIMILIINHIQVVVGKVIILKSASFP